MKPVDVEVERRADHLLVHWTDGARSGTCRFDHLPESFPPWLGAAEELVEGADRRSETRVLGAVAAWAREAGFRLGVWHDDEGVELLD